MKVVLLLLGCLLLAVNAQTIKEDRTPLRPGCSEAGDPVAMLMKGSRVKIRYSLAAADKPCYAVSVEVDGRQVQGYLSEADIIREQQAAPPPGSTTPGAESIQRAIGAMRGVSIESLSQSQVAAINLRLDQAWKTILSAGAAGVPLITSALSAEASNTGRPDFFFLFDASRLLNTIEPGKHWDVIAQALAPIDPDNYTMRANAEPYFRLAHELAKTGRPEALPALWPFLHATQTKFEVPLHATTVDATLMCVFLFGSYGPAAEGALLQRWSSRRDEHGRILVILGWIGTEKSTATMEELYARETSHDLLTSAFVILTTHGGEQGRRFLLETPVAGKDRQFQAYYRKTRPDLYLPVYEHAACQFQDPSGQHPAKLLTREELNRLLAKIEADEGRTGDVSPMTVLISGDGRDVPQLVRIRSLMLHNVSRHGMDDVWFTNALIAALNAKSAAPSTLELQKQADSGDAEAQFRLSLRCRCGIGVAANQALAERYMKSAATLGYQPAAVLTRQP